MRSGIFFIIKSVKGIGVPALLLNKFIEHGEQHYLDRKR